MKFFHLKEKINKTTEIYSFEKQNSKNDSLFILKISFFNILSLFISKSSQSYHRKKEKGRKKRGRESIEVRFIDSRGK